jgi:hypothetical protein
LVDHTLRITDLKIAVNRKGNNQQSEEIAYRLGENPCQLFI